MPTTENKDKGIGLRKKRQNYGKRYLEKSVYDLALERIEYSYNMFDHIVVSFSGGKDSTAVLNLTYEVAEKLGKLPLHVVFFDEEAIQDEVEDYVRRVAARPGIKLDWITVPLLHGNAASLEQDYWIVWDPAEKDKWVRPIPPEGITELANYDPTKKPRIIPEIMPMLFPPEEYGRVGCLLGIRAQESLTRFQAVSRRKFDNYIVAGWTGGDFGSMSVNWHNYYKVMPIYDWTTEDVWTAPSMFGWDYCKAYDLMEMAGITAHNQRIAPPFGTQAISNLWMYKVCFPDLWDKMVERVPGTMTAAQYFDTELFSAQKSELPEGMTWPGYIKSLLDNLEPEMKVQIAKQVRKYIKTHDKKTGGLPIAAYVVHPDTGVSWQLLADIIIRKDDKGRIRPDMKMVKPNTDKYEKAITAYNNAIQAEIAGLDAREKGTRY